MSEQAPKMQPTASYVIVNTLMYGAQYPRLTARIRDAYRKRGDLEEVADMILKFWGAPGEPRKIWVEAAEIICLRDERYKERWQKNA